MAELGWVEHHLPGSDGFERVALARRLGLALEVANRPETDARSVRDAGIPIVTLQAWGMHEAHPLHPDAAVRAAAAEHVRDTLRLAARLGAPRALTICGYGSETCERPHETCRDFFRSLADDARALGVRILIEPLSPLRCAAMSSPGEVARLLGDLDPDVFAAALDTGHLLDAGLDPGAVFGGFPARVDEVQLRAAGSRIPGAELPLERWLRALPAPPEAVVVEHPEPAPGAAVAALVDRLRAHLTQAGGGIA